MGVSCLVRVSAGWEGKCEKGATSDTKKRERNGDNNDYAYKWIVSASKKGDIHLLSYIHTYTLTL